MGTHLYDVCLSAGMDEELDYECDCPVGVDGDFCKHAVAVALSWLENVGEEVFPEADEERAKPRKKRKTNEDQIREYLATLGTEDLRDLLVEAAYRDRDTRDKLLFSARARAVNGAAALKSVVRQITRVSGDVDWRRAGDYARRLADLAQMLDQRIADRDPKLVDIIEQAIAGAEDALGHIDDSNGSIMPMIMELRDVHLRSCVALKPDPVKLAERLFRFQTGGNWDTFHSVLPAYGDALGQSGLSRYRELVESAWSELPAIGPKAFATHFDVGRFRIEHAMEELARLSGDVEAVVRVFTNNLSSPHAFHRLVETLADHGRHDEALAWAEKGIRAFKREGVDDLEEFCIDEYLRRGELDHVEQLVWNRFLKHPRSEKYFELIGVAERIGSADAVAAKAMAHLWSLVAAEEAADAKRRAGWQPGTRSSIVAIHVRLEAANAAWEAFRGGPVHIGLWSEVAALRGRTHPDEAISLYKQMLPETIQQGSAGARYDGAVAIVKAIRELRATQGMSAVFEDELAELRAAWKAKRNFIKLLDGLGIS